MRRVSRSPSYLVRTPHSYCFRLNVPADLQKFVGKTELRYTLTTGYVGLARSKARLLAGHLQEFFRRLREIIKLGELTDQQIVDMVSLCKVSLFYHQLDGSIHLDSVCQQ